MKAFAGSNPVLSAEETWQSLADCTGLENQRWETIRGFKSHRFRHRAGISYPALLYATTALRYSENSPIKGKTMGCFNVTCGITSANTTHGDAAGLIFLEPRPSIDKDLYIGPTSRFIPIAPPIYGEYNDYGSLENITNVVATMSRIYQPSVYAGQSREYGVFIAVAQAIVKREEKYRDEVW